jgi:hypothetical protein
MQLIEFAVEQGRSIEELEKLMDLKERHEAAEAKKAFDQAMAGFRGEAVQILKRKKAGFEHKSGGGYTEYHFADLADCVDDAVPALSKWGLSHDWNTEQLDGGVVKVTCTLTHAMGHSKSTSLQASPDTTGSKNNIQAIGSTVNYLERYTFLAVTGLAAKGQDDDGAGAGSSGDASKVITPEDADKIRKLLKDLGTDENAFLKWCKSDSIDTIGVQKVEYIIVELKRQLAHQNAENQDGESE